MGELSTFKRIIAERRRDVLLVLLWTAAIALVIIRNHQQFYADNEMMSYSQIGYLPYRGPAPTTLDLLAIVLVSMAISMFILSMKSLIFGYFASWFLSCIAAVVYVFLFNWYVLEIGVVFADLPFGWEWVLFQAIVNVFKYVFPLGFTFSLIGVGAGGALKVLMNRD